MKVMFPIAVLVVILSGCSASLVTKQIDLSSEQPASGVTYYLPTQNLQITVKRSVVTKEKLDAEIAKQQTAVSDQNKKIAEQKALIELSTKKVAAAEGEVKAKLGLNLELEKIDLLMLQQVLLEQKTKLTSLQQSVRELGAKAGMYRDEFTLSSTALQPDLSRIFVANVKKNFWTSETFELKTSPSGLLSSGSGKSEGNVDEIVIAMANAFGSLKSQSDLAKPFFKTRSLLLGDSTRSDNCSKAEEREFKAEFLFTDDSLIRLGKQMAGAGFCYDLKWQQEPKELNTYRTLPKELCKEGCVGGLLYPRQVRVGLNISSHPINHDQTLYVNVVDQRSLAYVPIDASTFATNEYDYEFKDGLLVRYKSVTPNEFVGFFSMIPAAAKALVKIPAEMLQLKIDYSSKEEGYYKAQKTLLEARLAYEKALEAEQD